MADDKSNHPQLNGFIARKGIKYFSGIDYKNYTQDALRKFLKPAARGTKKTTSKDNKKK
jgi:hypothetical protein